MTDVETQSDRYVVSVTLTQQASDPIHRGRLAGSSEVFDEEVLKPRFSCVPSKLGQAFFQQ
jgi:hypothetical protein